MDRTLRVVAGLAGALFATAALATDPPHDKSENPNSCQGCHLLHNSLGGSLTKKDTNATLCDSCHALVMDTDGKHFGFPWTPMEQVQAAPGASGYSHRWDASVTSRGANSPSNPNMAGHLDGTFIMCSTCHDQHSNTAGANSGAQHIGGSTGTGTVGVGSDWTPNGNATEPPVASGTGTMKLDTVTAMAAPKSYHVRVTAVNGQTITFSISHDRGATWAATGLTATAQGAAVNLDDGANVKVSFTLAASSYKVNDYWELWVSYPMLQMANDDNAAPGVPRDLCEDCHSGRVHSSTRVTGGDATYPANGINKFSHPVGQTLARSYDRATPLDANGLAQTTEPAADADANRTNNIRLDSNSKVRCTSCHHVHNADSNSLTVDPR